LFDVSFAKEKDVQQDPNKQKRSPIGRVNQSLLEFMHLIARDDGHEIQKLSQMFLALCPVIATKEAKVSESYPCPGIVSKHKTAQFDSMKRDYPNFINSDLFFSHLK